MKPWTSKLSATEIRGLKKTFPRPFGVEIECGVKDSGYKLPKFNKRSDRSECKYDYSLTVPYLNEREYTIKVNSYDRLKDLWNLTEYIKQQNGIVNSSCGLHVHIGIEHVLSKCEYNARQFFFDILETLYYNDERTVNDLCGRHGTYYAQRGINHRYGDRYSAINTQTNKPTIEFRQMEGTVDYDRIICWVVYLEALVDKAYKQTMIAFPTNV